MAGAYTGWWIGACDDTSWLHNVVGILSEMASVKLATPIYIEPTEIPKAYTQRRMEFPDPWPGGWWRLRDIVDYELTLSLSLLNTASRFKEEFLMNSYLMSKSAIEKHGQGPALRLRHPGPPERRADDDQDAGDAGVRRLRDPAGQEDFIGRRQVVCGRVVRGLTGPALQALCLGPARAAEIPGYTRIPRRPPDPALRQRGLDAAAADGGPLRPDREALCGQAGAGG